MIEDRIQELWKKRIAGTASEEEQELLHEWLANDESREQLFQLLQESYDALSTQKQFFSGEEKEEMLQYILGGQPVQSPLRKLAIFRNWKWVAAAAVLLLAGGWFWYFHDNKPAPSVAPTAIVLDDIPPGKEGAVLTLADGSRLVLDSLGNGPIAKQNGADVVLQNGNLAYNSTGSFNTLADYNTISTPKGRQFRLELPDGSKVWLNAASSIRFPTVFNGNERKVEITGEAWFEVVKDVKKPFRVSIDPVTEVEVLGTSFNINSYNNEEVTRTTLLDGAVRFRYMDQSKLLAPGQQAQTGKEKKIKVASVDTDKVIAWKSGYFNFDDNDLYALMRQLERWYDIEVKFEGPAPVVEFHGKLQRNLNLSQILMVLKRMEIRYRMEGDRRLIIQQ
ncbi:MAG: FecR domain-containing protein [Chitinophagaceae bacterium]|nr:FecR domain-containing protein [Chitinophagaceae bacterium]